MIFDGGLHIFTLLPSAYWKHIGHISITVKTALCCLDLGSTSVLSSVSSSFSSSLAHRPRSSNHHPPFQPVPLASSTLPSPCPQSHRDRETPISHLSSYSPSSSTAHPAGLGWASRTSGLSSCRLPPSKQPVVQLFHPGFLGATCLITSNPRMISQISILLCPHAVSRISDFYEGLLLCYSSECRPASFPRFQPKKQESAVFFTFVWKVCLFWKVWRRTFYHRMISVFLQVDPQFANVPAVYL